MIRLKCKELDNVKNVLDNLKDKKYSASVAYKIARLKREIDKEYETFINEKVKLINECADRDDAGTIKNNGDSILIKKDKVNYLNQEMSKLSETEIVLNAEKIDVNELFTEPCSIEYIEKVISILK